ncbi:hypothetical protein [Candidatus Solirubrobacter pratensis]|uniref:hypothetical protein n=1 Tax=Candidatus Solirubrobacter pratensis TaxID=1298857 RepID=UPI00040830F8|nr:hypothetical protein [Candidatus Solirubrobacter pratensis]
MKKVNFAVERSYVGGLIDAALLDEGEDPTQQVMRQVWDDLSTDLNVKISGVTMFAAAWEDPDHWSQDWAEKLGIDSGDVPEAVAALIASAIEEDAWKKKDT